MKYIRFNRVIFKKERERKMLISKKVFDERGRIIVLRLFPKFASKFLSWNRAISLSLLLTHSLVDSGSKGVRRNATYHAEFLFIRKGDSFSKHNVSFPINSRGLPPSILAIVTDTGYGNLPLPVKHYSCFNVRCGEVSQSKRSESACVHFC